MSYCLISIMDLKLLFSKIKVIFTLGSVHLLFKTTLIPPEIEQPNEPLHMITKISWHSPLTDKNISRAEPDLEFEGLLKRQHTRVKYFQGSLMNAIDLERVKVTYLHGAFICKNQRQDVFQCSYWWQTICLLQIAL